jgi:hypothetical protein
MTIRALLLICLALIWASRVRAADTATEMGVAAAKPGASFPGMPTGTNEELHRRFAQMRKDDAQKSLAQAQSMIGRAEDGACGERGRRNASGYRDVLASISAEMAKGDATMKTYPPMAAVHYKRADGMTQRLLQGAAGANCTVEP